MDKYKNSFVPTSGSWQRLFPLPGLRFPWVTAWLSALDPSDYSDVLSASLASGPLSPPASSGISFSSALPCRLGAPGGAGPGLPGQPWDPEATVGTRPLDLSPAACRVAFAHVQRSPTATLPPPHPCITRGLHAGAGSVRNHPVHRQPQTPALGTTVTTWGVRSLPRLH